MNSHPQTSAPTVPFDSSAPVPTPAEQVAKAQAKAAKKERKHARLRGFFSWCWGCQAMSGSF